MANATKIRSSVRIYILLIRMQTSTTLCNMLFCTTHNFHTCIINSFGNSVSNLHPRRIQTYILHSNFSRIWVKMILFEKLTKNLITSMLYTFGLPLRSFYGTINLAILVISTSKIIKNILMESQSSAALLLKCFINNPLVSKLIYPRYPLDMVPLVLTHKNIKAYLLNLTSLV